MKGILIDPVTKTVTEVDYTGNYKNIYVHLGVDCFTVVGISPTETIFVDDEGLYREDQKYFIWKGYYQPLAGKGLILGIDKAGESVATELDVEYVKSMVSFPDIEFSHFEDFEGTTNWHGMEMPMIGHRAIFKPKQAE